MACDASHLTKMSFEQPLSHKYLSPFNSVSHLLPLVDVADESGQAKQSKQAQDFCEADNAQCPGCSVHLGVKTVHHQEDVVHRDG